MTVEFEEHEEDGFVIALAFYRGLSADRSKNITNTGEKCPFLVSDVNEITNTSSVSVIEAFYRTTGNNGDGVGALKKFCKEYFSSTDVVALKAMPVETTLYGEVRENLYYTIVDKLVSLYTRAGFIDVNDVLGHDDGSVMIFKNKATRKHLNKRR